MSHSDLRRLSIAILLIVFLTPIVGQAAVINVMEFRQLSFFPVDGSEPVLNSSKGEMFLAMDAGPDTEYLNLHAYIPGLSTEPYWVVRNLLLHDDTVGAPYEEYSVRFPMDALGVEDGLPITEIMFGFSIDPVPLLDVEYEDWALNHPVDQFGPVLFSEIDTGRFGVSLDLDLPDITTLPPDTFWPTFTDLSDSTIAGILGCLVNNVELDSSQTTTDYAGCVPAACANSLDWLRTFDDDINFPGTLRETYEQLSRLMNRNSPTGVWPEEMMQAKMDFIEAHNLPIEVKYQNRLPRRSPVTSTSGHSTATDHGAANTWPTAEWLRNEVNSGEDVEMNVSYWYASAGTLACDGAHCMVVTGAGRSASGDWVFFKDDLEQGTNGGQRQVPTAMVPGQFGAIYLPGEGYKKIIPGTPPDTVQVNARLDSVVSESYKAGGGDVPTSETTSGYCEVFARTIRLHSGPHQDA